MALNPYSKKHYDYLKKNGTQLERMQTAKLSKAYCLIDPQAAAWAIQSVKAQQLAKKKEKTPPSKPSKPETKLPFADELKKWDKEEQASENVSPITDLPNDEIPF